MNGFFALDPITVLAIDLVVAAVLVYVAIRFVPRWATWQRLTANERVAAAGTLVVMGAWLVGQLGTGIGIMATFSGSMPLLGAIVLLSVYWLRYSPTYSSNWPAASETIAVVMGTATALITVLGALPGVAVLGMMSAATPYAVLPGPFVVILLAGFGPLIATIVGALAMAIGTWRAYRASRPAAL